MLDLIFAVCTFVRNAEWSGRLLEPGILPFVHRLVKATFRAQVPQAVVFGSHVKI